jgi:hypothetical protein
VDASPAMIEARIKALGVEVTRLEQAAEQND